MTHAQVTEQKPRDAAAQEKFLAEELHRLSETNARLAAEHQANKDEIAARRAKRHAFVTACMDERCAHVEEALGLLPGEADVYGSGGARISMETFDGVYAPELQRTLDAGGEAVVYLTTHLCGTGVEYGCAAFKSDVPAQVAYFKELKRAIAAAHPGFFVHVLMQDTANDHLSAVEADERDAKLADVIATSETLAPSRPNLDSDGEQTRFAHAAYGIYVGDAYRAWEDGYNRYFRLDAANTDLAGNLGIAFAVMLHHSTMDLAAKPIVLLIDYPKYGDAEKTEAARAAIDERVTEALREPEAAELLASGQLKVVKTATDAETWEGRQVGQPGFEK